jgi:hypothetical protein
MDHRRVLKYEATVYYTSTGSSHTKQYAFTPEQADEVGAVFHSDGIDLAEAERLCEIWTKRWTKRGRSESIRYSYRIPL